MRVNVNLFSFIIALISVILFLVLTSSNYWIDLSMQTLGWHPLFIVLGLTLATFVLAVVGFKDIKGWAAMTRGIITLAVSTGLSIIAIFILFIGKLMS
ncbi:MULTISPECIES: hypothetical protein [unclassified Psychrobacillus]|uniref:hypothetical protein n=1 Tax=unclassified Psychrobacillus TaxID=2636677 RepID=UPI0030F9DAA4